MLCLKNSVATLALMALASTSVPLAVAQDQSGSEPQLDVESLVDSLASDEGDGAAVADEVLPEEVLLTDEELDELVAPVALYPDALLAQVLVASTYPLQIVKADRIIADSAELSDDALSETLVGQDFDPSILVLLSGFPTVVQRMAEDLDWTEQLGIAMLQQDEDVLAAVQRMRADARDMGYLSSNDAQTVEEDDGQIYIQPSQPDVVYVPTYDPSVVYTSPAPAEPYYVAPAESYYSAPAESYYAAPTQTQSPFSAQNLLTTGVIAFGSALLVNELWGDDDDDDDDDDDWDNYWRRPRPIAWQDREFYPRPYWNRDRAENARAWSWERDNYWRRSDDRWRREAARDRREYERDRFEALGALRDPQRVRAVRESGQWSALEEQRRERQAIRARQERRDEALRDQRQELRKEAETAERRQDGREEAKAAERRQERRKDAEATERRQEKVQQERREERAQAQRADERQAVREREERRKEREAEARQQERREEVKAAERRKERLEGQRREERAQGERTQEQQRARAEAEKQQDRQVAKRRQAERADTERRAQREQSAQREAANRQRANERAAAQQRPQKARQETPQAEPRRGSGDQGQDNKRGEQASQKQGGDNKRCRGDNKAKDCK